MMTKIALIALLLLSGLPAIAAETDFSSWQFTQTTGSRDTPLCVMFSAVKNKDVGQNVGVKGSATGLVVDLYYDKWTRPQGGSVRVAFDFFDHQPLTLDAYADGHILDVQIPTQVTATFLLELAERPGLQVSFPGSTVEPEWTVKNGDAKPAVQQLTACCAT
jgi:hypothetical protein